METTTIETAPKVMTRIAPTQDRLLIERLPEVTKTEGGIHIPEASTSKPNQGYIRDMGPQVNTQFAIGDKVMVMQYAGIEMGIDGRQFLLIRQDEIVGIVTEVPVNG